MLGRMPSYEIVREVFIRKRMVFPYPFIKQGGLCEKELPNLVDGELSPEGGKVTYTEQRYRG